MFLISVVNLQSPIGKLQPISKILRKQKQKIMTGIQFWNWSISQHHVFFFVFLNVFSPIFTPAGPLLNPARYPLILTWPEISRKARANSFKKHVIKYNWQVPNFIIFVAELLYNLICLFEKSRGNIIFSAPKQMGVWFCVCEDS